MEKCHELELCNAMVRTTEKILFCMDAFKNFSLDEISSKFLKAIFCFFYRCRTFITMYHCKTKELICKHVLKMKLTELPQQFGFYEKGIPALLITKPKTR